MNNDVFNAPGFDQPRGYSDAVRVAADRRLVFLAGHVAFDANRTIQDPGELVPQVGAALRNLKATLEAAGGAPEDLVKLTILVTDVQGWRDQSKAVGVVWRDAIGKVYPATTLIPVSELFDLGAVVEIEGIAAVPAEGCGS